MGIIDSRSIKSSHHINSDKGISGHKKVRGRKQNVIVDIVEFSRAITVHEANIHDSKGAPGVIKNFAFKFSGLVKILADGGYCGNLAR